MRDYGFDFEKLQEDHPLYPCGACPYKSLCNSLDDDDPAPCEEQKQYNMIHALLAAADY